jgi:hypothetical protein
MKKDSRKNVPILNPSSGPLGLTELVQSLETAAGGDGSDKLDSDRDMSDRDAFGNVLSPRALKDSGANLPDVCHLFFFLLFSFFANFFYSLKFVDSACLCFVFPLFDRVGPRPGEGVQAYEEVPQRQFRFQLERP